MTDPNYHKCRSCRFCRHEGEAWFCTIDGVPTTDGSSCDRYRPGCCENCNSYESGVCGATGDEVYAIEVCPEYDPKGSV